MSERSYSKNDIDDALLRAKMHASLRAAARHIDEVRDSYRHADIREGAPSYRVGQTAERILELISELQVRIKERCDGEK